MVRKLELHRTNTKLNNMEYIILLSVFSLINEGKDQHFVRKFIENEIDVWKQKDRYKNSKTILVYRSQWEMVFMNGDTVLAILKTTLLS